MDSLNALDLVPAWGTTSGFIIWILALVDLIVYGFHFRKLGGREVRKVCAAIFRWPEGASSLLSLGDFESALHTAQRFDAVTRGPGESYMEFTISFCTALKEYGVPYADQKLLELISSTRVHQVYTSPVLSSSEVALLAGDRELSPINKMSLGEFFNWITSDAFVTKD